MIKTDLGFPRFIAKRLDSGKCHGTIVGPSTRMLALGPAVSQCFTLRAPALGVRPHSAPRSPLVRASALPAAQLPTSFITAVDSGVVTDTLLDVAVYTLLAGIAALTIYSIYVTLQKSNEEYGGWTPRDDQEVPSESGASRPGAIYDPVTEKWTYPTEEDPTPAARIGRAPNAPADGPNRYERRTAKRQKAASRRGGKKRR